MDLGGAGATSSAPPRALPELRTTGSAPPRARSCRPCHQPCSHHHALAFRTLSTNGPITPPVLAPHAVSPAVLSTSRAHQPTVSDMTVAVPVLATAGVHVPSPCHHPRSLSVCSSALASQPYQIQLPLPCSAPPALAFIRVPSRCHHPCSPSMSSPVLAQPTVPDTVAVPIPLSPRTRDRPYHVQFPSPNSFRWDRPKPAPHANCQLNETPSIRDAFRKSGQPFFRAFAAIGLKEGYPLSYLKAGYPISYPSVGDKKSPGRWPQAPACFKSGEDKAYLPEHIEPHGMRRCLSFSYKGVCCRPPTLP